MTLKIGPRALSVTTICIIWALLFVALVIAVLAICAITLHLTDSTTFPSFLASLICSCVFVIYLILYHALARRVCTHERRRQERRRTCLDSACSWLPPSLIAAWIISDVFGLIVIAIVAKRSLCTTSYGGGPWHAGAACKIHRAVVATSVIALFLQLTLFCLLELVDRSLQHTLLGIRAPHRILRREERLIGKAPSSPSSSGSSHVVNDRLEALPHFPRSRSQQAVAEHASWLLRRNSLSSQQAVFPSANPLHRHHYHPCCGQPGYSTTSFGSRRLRRSASNPAAFSINTTSPSWYTVNTTGPGAVSGNLLPPSRSTSFISSISTQNPHYQHHACNQISPSKTSSTTGTIRLVGGPCLPPPIALAPHQRQNVSIPDRFRSITTCRTATTLRAVSENDYDDHSRPLLSEVEEAVDEGPEDVPSWSSPLRQTPLSADPQIRALSTTHGRWLSVFADGRRSDESTPGPDTTLTVPQPTQRRPIRTPTSDTAPTIPKRAPSRPLPLPDTVGAEGANEQPDRTTASATSRRKQPATGARLADLHPNQAHLLTKNDTFSLHPPLALYPQKSPNSGSGSAASSKRRDRRFGRERERKRGLNWSVGGEVSLYSWSTSASAGAASASVSAYSCETDGGRARGNLLPR